MVSIYEVTGLLIAFVAAVYTWTTAKESSVKAYVVTFVLMIGACLTMLVSIRYHQIPGLSNKLSAVTPDHRSGALLSDFRQADDVLRSSTDPFFQEYFAHQLSLFQEALRDAGSGKYRVNSEMIGVFANKVIDIARDSVVATSYVDAAEWWDTPWGQRYEALNYEKVSQGVNITRYFLFSSPEEEEKAQAMLRRQVENGVEVLIVNPRDASAIYWNDIILIDGRVGGELLLTPEKTIRHVIMYTRHEDLRRLSTNIEGLRVRSRPFRTTQQ